jgi:hypothetical protein
MISPIQFKSSDFENTNPQLPDIQKFANFARWKINSKGATFLLGRSSNSKWILN